MHGLGAMRLDARKTRKLSPLTLNVAPTCHSIVLAVGLHQLCLMSPIQMCLNRVFRSLTYVPQRQSGFMFVFVCGLCFVGCINKRANNEEKCVRFFFWTFYYLWGNLSDTFCNLLHSNKNSS